MTFRAPEFAGMPIGWAAIFSLVNLIIGGGAFAAWIKLRPKMRELQLTAQEQFIETLAARLDKVEVGREADRRMHYIQVARLEARHAAQRSLDRHKFNNSEACLDALLIRLEAGQPVAEAVRLVQDMRIRQRESERTEAATIHAAEIEAVARAEKELEDADTE
jgi:hypothetical protein